MSFMLPRRMTVPDTVSRRLMSAARMELTVGFHNSEQRGGRRSAGGSSA